MAVHWGNACEDGFRDPLPMENVHGGVETPVRPLELQQWAAWLRLNESRQVRGAFRRRQRDGAVHVCVIGALEEIAAAEATFLFSPMNEPKFMRQVLLRNDSLGWTFPQIADWLDGIADGTISLGRALEVRIPADLPLCEPVA